MSVQVTPAQMDSLKATLLNTSGSTPLHERFRALFMLKAVNNDEVVKIVSEGMSKSSSVEMLPFLPLEGRRSLCRNVEIYR
jgi:deoxyhypusine monooxygenase